MSRSLIKDSAIYSLGTFLTRSLGFLLIPLYTRYLNVAEYGTLALLNLLLQLTIFICLLGVSTAAMRGYYDKDADAESRGKIYGNALFLLMVFPGLVLVVLGPLIWFLVSKYLVNVPFFPYVFIMLVIGLLNPFIKLIIGLLRVQRRPKSFIIFNTCFFLLQTLTIIGAVAWLDFGLEGQVYSQLIANFVFSVIAFIILFRFSRPQFDLAIAKRILKFGIPLVPFFIFMWINEAAGRFVLERFSDLSEVGIFALAAQFSGLMQTFATALDNALMPHFLQRAGRDESGEELGVLVKRYLTLFGLFGLGMMIVATPTIRLMATPDYFSAGDYIAPLLLAGWLAIANKPIVWSLTYSEQTGLLAIIRGASTGVVAALLILFVGYLDLGIMGVAYAMIGTHSFALVGAYMFAGDSIAMRVPWARMISICFTMLAGAVAVSYLAPVDLDLGRIAMQGLVLCMVALVTMKIAGIPSLSELIRPAK